MIEKVCILEEYMLGTNIVMFLFKASLSKHSSQQRAHKSFRAHSNSHNYSVINVAIEFRIDQ